MYAWDRNTDLSVTRLTTRHLSVLAALLLTQCDLSTAALNLPLECNILDSDVGSDFQPCVLALSRSTQYWSTYSGYLRDTHAICYVSWFEDKRDNMEQWLKDSAQKQQDLYQVLAKMTDTKHKRDDELVAGIQLQMNDLSRHSDETHRALFDFVQSLAQETKKANAALSKTFEESMLAKLAAIHHEGNIKAHEMSKSLTQQALHSMAIELSRVAGEHANTLRLNEQVHGRHIDQLLQSLDTAAALLTNDLQAHYQELDEMTGQLSRASQGVDGLSQRIQDIDHLAQRSHMRLEQTALSSVDNIAEAQAERLQAVLLAFDRVEDVFNRSIDQRQRMQNQQDAVSLLVEVVRAVIQIYVSWSSASDLAPFGPVVSLLGSAVSWLQFTSLSAPAHLTWQLSRGGFQVLLIVLKGMRLAIWLAITDGIFRLARPLSMILPALRRAAQYARSQVVALRSKAKRFQQDFLDCQLVECMLQLKDERPADANEYQHHLPSLGKPIQILSRMKGREDLSPSILCHEKVCERGQRSVSLPL